MDATLLTAKHRGRRVRIRLHDTSEWLEVYDIREQSGTMVRLALCGQPVWLALRDGDDIQVIDVEPEGCDHEHCHGASVACPCACHFSLSRGN